MTSLSTRTLSRPLACCCGSSASKPYKIIEKFPLVTCQSCGLIRLKEVQCEAVDFLEDVKKDDGLEYWGFPTFHKKYEFIFNHFFHERFERIKKAYLVEGRWFDIGSGYGFWQKFLDDKKIMNAGIEIEKKAVEYAQTLNVDIEHISIEKFTTNETFVVITMCDVLEHVEKPDEILQKCYDLLAPGGLLYIQVPNVIGLKYPYKDSLGLPHHLWQFDPPTLINLLTKENFHICEYWTGVQGVIRYYEQGGPSLYRQFLWKMARLLRRGNRLQVLVRK